MMNQTAYGSETSASSLAAISITVGFKPTKVTTWTTDKKVDFTKSMTAGKGFCFTHSDTTVNTNEHVLAADYAELSANGITLSDTGFTIGTACQKASAVIHWIAER